MFKVLIITTMIILLSGCSYRITDVDVSGKDKQCVRECTKSYSNAVSQGNQIGFKTETLRAAKDAFVICIDTCDSK